MSTLPDQRPSPEKPSPITGLRAAIDRFNDADSDPNGTEADLLSAAGDAIAAFNDLDARLGPHLSALRAAFAEFDRLESDPYTDGNDASLDAGAAALEAFRRVDHLLTGDTPS